MDFSQRQRDPRRHVAGLIFVVLFHVAIVYALVSGLAKKVVEVVRAPIETKVIEEVKPPPPPPEVMAPPPPRLEAPPPPFIPPPEIQIAAPPPPQPTITATTPTPPPAPVAIAPSPPPEAPPAPPAPAPAPPPPRPAGVQGVCSKTVQPQAPSVNVEVSATIVVAYTIQRGKITQVDVVKQTYRSKPDRKVQRAIMASIEAAASQYVCEGDHVNVTQEFVFTIN